MDRAAIAAAPRETIRGHSIIRALVAAGIEYVISVPDITTSEGLLRPLARGEGPPLIRVCKEDEGVGIASGLSYCGKRAILLIQQTGLMDSLNALRSAGCDYGLPICFMVGLLEKEPAVSPYQSQKFGVRIVPQIMDVMGIAHRTLETEEEAVHIRPAIDHAYAVSRPTVLFLGRRPASS